MSDVLDRLGLQKFKNRFQVNLILNQSLNYVRNSCISENETVVTIHVGNEILKHWHEVKKDLGCTYVEIINVVLRDQALLLRVKDDCERIEGRLRRVCGELTSKFKGKSGSAYRKLAQHVYKLQLHAGDVQDIEPDLETVKLRNEEILKENKTLSDQCEDLFKQLQEANAAKKELDGDLEQAKINIEKLEKENKQLHAYIEKLGQDLDFENHSGKVTEVRERQQRRKLTELKTNTEKALWFAKTFGLELESVSFADDKGDSHTMDFTEKEKKSFKDLSESEQDLVKNVLFVLDKFCIGDAAYHELTMSPGGEGLPRSYLIKQCKTDLNSLCHIVRTPGEAEGAQLDFTSELEAVIKNKVRYMCVFHKINKRMFRI